MQVPGGTSVLLMLGQSEICCSAIGLRLILISEPFAFSLKIQIICLILVSCITIFF